MYALYIICLHFGGGKGLGPTPALCTRINLVGLLWVNAMGNGEQTWLRCMQGKRLLSCYTSDSNNPSFLTFFLVFGPHLTILRFYS